MLFLFFLSALSYSETSERQSYIDLVYDFLYGNVQLQTLLTNFSGMSWEDANQIYNDVVSAFDKPSFLDFRIETDYDPDPVLLFDFDTKFIEFFKDENGHVDKELINQFIESTKLFTTKPDLGLNFLRQLGYTGNHLFDVYTLLNSREKLEKTSINDLIKYMGFEYTTVKKVFKVVGEFLGGDLTVIQTIEKLGINQNEVQKAYDKVKEMFVKNEIGLPRLQEIYESLEIALKDLYNVLKDTFKDLFKPFSEMFDISLFNFSGLVEEGLVTLKDFRDIDDKVFNSTYFEHSLDEFIKQYENFLNDGINITELCEITKEELRGILKPYIKLFANNLTMNDILHLAVSLYDNETRDTILNYVTGLRKWAEPSTPLDRAFEVFNIESYVEYIKTGVKALGSRTQNFYDGLRKYLSPEYIESIQKGIDSINYTYNKLLEIDQTIVESFNESITEDVVKQVDEWLPLNKTLTYVFDLAGFKREDLIYDIEGFVVSLDDYRAESSIAESLYNFLTKILDALKDSTNATTIKEFCQKLDLPMDQIVDNATRLWNDMKNKPVKDLVNEVDFYITYVKIIETAQNIIKLDVVNLYTVLNSIAYDSSYENNFKKVFQFAWDFEANLYQAGQKVEKNQKLTLKDITGLIGLDKYFFDYMDKVFSTYDTYNVALSALIKKVTGYDFTTSQQLLSDLYTNIVYSEKINYQQFVKIENSIEDAVKSGNTDVDTNNNNNNNKHTTIIIIGVVSGVAVILVIVVVSIILYRRHMKAKRDQSMTQSLLI